MMSLFTTMRSQHTMGKYSQRYTERLPQRLNVAIRRTIGGMAKQKELITYAAIAVASIGLILVVVALSLPDWIVVSGRDSVCKTRANIKKKSNVSAQEWLDKWPQHQAQYDAMATQKTTLFAAIGTLKQSLITTNASLQTLLSSDGGQGPGQTQSLEAQIKAIAGNLVTQGENLKKIMIGMAKLKAMNASLTAFDEMATLKWKGGFFEMCTKHATAGRCGSPSSFRNETLDEVCDPDYNKSTTIPTRETVLLKTHDCNANGLADALMKSGGFFGGLIIVALVVGVLVTLLVLASVLLSLPDNCLFTTVFMGVIYIVAGVLALVMAGIFNMQVVGGYRKQGMPHTSMGLSGILCMVGGALFVVVGLLLAALHFKKSEVAPVDNE